jgi:hypothetical protein
MTAACRMVCARQGKSIDHLLEPDVEHRQPLLPPRRRCRGRRQCHSCRVKIHRGERHVYTCWYAGCRREPMRPRPEAIHSDAAANTSYSCQRVATSLSCPTSCAIGTMVAVADPLEMPQCNARGIQAAEPRHNWYASSHSSRRGRVNLVRLDSTKGPPAASSPVSFG